MGEVLGEWECVGGVGGRCVLSIQKCSSVLSYHACRKDGGEQGRVEEERSEGGKEFV